MMLVTIKRVPGLVHKDSGVRLELERDNHALRRPALNQVLQELGYRIQVDNQTLAPGHCWGGIKVVKRFFLVGWWRSGVAALLEGLDGICALDLVL